VSEAQNEPRILTADELLGVDDRPEQIVDVPEWGGAVKVRALSLGAFQDAQEACTVNGDLDEQKMAIEIIVRGVVDPPLTHEHAPLLRDKSVSALTSLMAEIAKLSAVTVEDLQAAERRFPDATG
jgi:hypothetical protein